MKKCIFLPHVTFVFLCAFNSLIGAPATKEELIAKNTELSQAVNNGSDNQIKELSDYFLTQFHEHLVSNTSLSRMASGTTCRLKYLCEIKEFRSLIAKHLSEILLINSQMKTIQEKTKEIHDSLSNLHSALANKMIQIGQLTFPEPRPEYLKDSLQIATLIDQSIGSFKNTADYAYLLDPILKHPTSSNPLITHPLLSQSSSVPSFARTVAEQVAVWVGAALALSGLKMLWDRYLLPNDKKYAQDANAPRVTFQDIAGIDEILGEVQEVIHILKHPDQYVRFGIKPPRGILFEGPPGVGKTLIARAIANEAGCSFMALSGAEFIEMYVGVGAQRIREVFNLAREHQPTIIFIDEIDAIGVSRLGESSSGGREYEQTLNQLLVEMDGFKKDQKVVVIGATNRAEILDPALKRPGRFTKIIQIKLPSEKARTQILNLYFGKLPLVDLEHIDISYLASQTNGFNSSELEDLVNIAALNALRRQADRVENCDAIIALAKAIEAHKARTNTSSNTLLDVIQNLKNSFRAGSPVP